MITTGLKSSPPTGKRSGKPFLSLLGAGALIAYLAWEVYFSTGLLGCFSALQFDSFGQSLPVLNLTAVLVLLGAAEFGRRRRRVYRATRAATQQVRTLALADDFASTLGDFRWFLITLALAVLLLVVGMTLAATPVRVVPPHWPAARLDATMMVGTPRNELASSLADDLFTTRQQRFFVPLIEPAAPRHIGYFIEVRPAPKWDGLTPPRADLSRPLMKVFAPRPGFVEPLYARSGYRVLPMNGVLTAEPWGLARPQMITAAYLLILALMSWAAQWFQARHRQNLARRLEPNAA